LVDDEEAAACFCVAWAAEADVVFCGVVVFVAAELAVDEAFDVVLPLVAVVLVEAFVAVVLLEGLVGFELVAWAAVFAAACPLGAAEL
jgi:hypothetical protein